MSSEWFDAVHGDPHGDRAMHVTRWWFLRGIGGVALLAFLSLATQIVGLLGPDGVLPAADFLDRVAGTDAVVPTLFWFSASEPALLAVVAVGGAASALLLANVAPRYALAAIFACYLSVVAVGQAFLSYQWDVLLLEAAFLGFFVAPGGLRPGGAATRPTALSVLALRVLAFKVLFMSGAAKLLSGDPTWWGLSALTHHFESQPLPTPLAPLAHSLPGAVLAVATLLVLLIEIVVPWFYFARRRWRLHAAGVSAALQLAILATGNYGFFNLLAIVLLVPLLDDDAVAALADRLPDEPRLRRAVARFRPPRVVDRRPAFAVPELVVLVALLALNAALLLPYLGLGGVVPGVAGEAVAALRPFHVANTYGLFAVMTTERPVLVVQGRRDGGEWRTYDFPFKPDAPTDPLPVVQPHQPRLDWQFWFAAYDRPGRQRWLQSLVERLLAGEEDVEGLLQRDPFPDGSPDAIRILRYRYEFAGLDGVADGRWWRASDREVYLPPVSRRGGAGRGSVVPAE